MSGASRAMTPEESLAEAKFVAMELQSRGLANLSRGECAAVRLLEELRDQPSAKAHATLLAAANVTLAAEVLGNMKRALLQLEDAVWLAMSSKRHAWLKCDSRGAERLDTSTGEHTRTLPVETDGSSMPDGLKGATRETKVTGG